MKLGDYNINLHQELKKIKKNKPYNILDEAKKNSN